MPISARFSVVAALIAAALAGFGIGAVLGLTGPSGSGATATATPSTPFAWYEAQSAEASCVTEPGREANGDKVTYEPAHVLDDDVETAWRCDGDGVGERLEIDLGTLRLVQAVGIVPGYAKTDPEDGSDRYAQNRRLSQVRWTFDDGTSYTQDLDVSPESRTLQTTRVPAVTTRRVVIEILASDEADRDTVAVSTLRVGM